MKFKLLSLFLAAFAFVSISNAVTEWPTVDTRDNGVGIKVGEVCKYNAAKSEIVCTSQTIENVEAIVGSATGTPGWLQYGKDYIGTSALGEGEVMTTSRFGAKPGATKRVIYIKRLLM